MNETKYGIDFLNYFTEEEKELVREYLKNNFADLELHKELNCSVDVSKAIGRTANVDIWVY